MFQAPPDKRAVWQHSAQHAGKKVKLNHLISLPIRASTAPKTESIESLRFPQKAKNVYRVELSPATNTVASRLFSSRHSKQQRITLTEARLDRLPGCAQQFFLGRYAGVDAVVLHHACLQSDTFEKERYQVSVGVCGGVGEGGVEATAVAGAIVGWDVHAEQDDVGPGSGGRLGHGQEVVFDLGHRIAAQAIVAAQFYDDQVGIVGVQGLGESCQAALGGLAADAGVDHCVAAVELGQALSEFCDPAGFALYPVCGADTVAKHQ